MTLHHINKGNLPVLPDSSCQRILQVIAAHGTAF